MQIGEKLTRPDASKVNGVNDKWDPNSAVLRIMMILVKNMAS